MHSLYSELKNDALLNIVNTLNEMDYIDHIIIGLDQANLKEFKHALQFSHHFKTLNYCGMMAIKHKKLIMNLRNLIYPQSNPVKDEMSGICLVCISSIIPR